MSEKFEPWHDKTNKVTVRPAKTQISLGIRPFWSESSLSAWRNLGSLATHWAQAKTLIRLGGCPGWSKSSLGAHSLCWFCHVAAHICKQKKADQLHSLIRSFLVLCLDSLITEAQWCIYEPRYEKTCLSHMRTTKLQISVRIMILTVFLAPFLFAA